MNIIRNNSLIIEYHHYKSYLYLEFEFGPVQRRNQPEFGQNPARGNRDDAINAKFVGKSPGQVCKTNASELNIWVIRCTNIKSGRLGKPNITEPKRINVLSLFHGEDLVHSAGQSTYLNPNPNEEQLGFRFTKFNGQLTWKRCK
jgi:hypothetical protein